MGRDSSALPNLLRWFDQWRDAARLVLNHTFWWLLHGSVNRAWILIENKAHFVRGYAHRFLCSVVGWVLYRLGLETASHFTLCFLLGVSLLCLRSVWYLLASKYPFKRCWIRFVICLMNSYALLEWGSGMPWNRISYLSARFIGYGVLISRIQLLWIDHVRRHTHCLLMMRLSFVFRHFSDKLGINANSLLTAHIQFIICA